MVCYLEFCDSDALPEESKELRFGRGLIKETPAHLNVAGHSLGGHLAMAFNRLFPQMNVDTLAVNGLGFKFNHGSVNNLFSQLNGAWQFNASRIENVYGQAGPKLAAMNNGTLQQPGGWDGLFIEDGLGHVGGHSAIQMTDSAAVYDLFVRLDAGLAAQSPAEALKSLLPLFEAGSGDDSQTLETLVKNLYKIVLGIEPQITKNNRESLYAHLFALQNSGDFKALSGKATVALLPGQSAEGIAARASGKDDVGLAYRYALRELNPFALIGADYSAHNSDGSLDLYDEATGKGAMSEAYLQDRAVMLAWLNHANSADTNSLNGVDYGQFDSKGWRFTDKTQNRSIEISGLQDIEHEPSPRIISFGGAEAEEITGGTESDRLYGGDGNDTLKGDVGDDYLEGGQGDDQLIGGAGADTLNGGAGNDTYLLDDKDDAIDTIEDADGKGSLIINGTVLQGGEAAGKGRWINKTQGTVFTLLGQGEHSTLIIQNEARPGQIYLRNWKNGQLGLTMAEAPVPEEIQRTTYDLSLKEDKNAYKSIQPEQAGNLKIINAIDVARGGLVGGYGGEDLIVGGTAARPNYAAILDGSSGSDIVWAGEQKTSIQQAMADGETETSNGRNNVLLNGHVGDDQLIGDAGHDVLFGGEGHDTLVGGAGADIIIADGEGIGLNTGGTSSEFAWALGGDPDQISSLHLHMGVAMVETAKADSTGRKLRAIHNIGMTVSPLANTDMSGLLSMEAKEQADGSVIWTNYADLHGGHYFGTNVGKGNDVIYAGAGNDFV